MSENMQPLRQALRQTLRRSLRDMGEEDRLALAWPVACGSALAGRAEVVRYDEGILTLAVASREWLSEFEQLAALLTSDLRRVSGVQLAAIHFELRQK
jgi:hypothetical protein